MPSFMFARTWAASKLRTAHSEGFSRIALKPQETKTVSFHVPQSQLAIWDTEGKWMVEAGNYTVWVGESSQASLTTKFVLKPR